MKTRRLNWDEMITREERRMMIINQFNSAVYPIFQRIGELKLLYGHPRWILKRKDGAQLKIKNIEDLMPISDEIIIEEFDVEYPPWVVAEMANLELHIDDLNKYYDKKLSEL